MKLGARRFAVWPQWFRGKNETAAQKLAACPSGPMQGAEPRTIILDAEELEVALGPVRGRDAVLLRAQGQDGGTRASGRVETDGPESFAIDLRPEELSPVTAEEEYRLRSVILRCDDPALAPQFGKARAAERGGAAAPSVEQGGASVEEDASEDTTATFERSLLWARIAEMEGDVPVQGVRGAQDFSWQELPLSLSDLEEVHEPEPPRSRNATPVLDGQPPEERKKDLRTAWMVLVALVVGALIGRVWLP